MQPAVAGGGGLVNTEITFLKCSHCAKTCGKRVETVIQPDSCAFGITNLNGKLACMGAAPDELPAGNFGSSCDGCTVTGTVLSCSRCADGKEGGRATQISTNDCAAFTNLFGDLACMTKTISPAITKSVEVQPAEAQLDEAHRDAVQSSSPKTAHDEL